MRRTEELAFNPAKALQDEMASYINYTPMLLITFSVDPAKAFAALLAVTRQRIFNHRQRLRRRLDHVHFHCLAFQLFVVEKETAQHG